MRASFDQLFRSGAPCSFLRERADVHFVNDLTLKFQAGPLRIAPSEFRWIDNARRTVRPIGLKARRRIGIKIVAGVYSETIARAGTNIDRPGEIAIWLGDKRMRILLRVRNVFQNDVNFRSFWSPNTKIGFVVGDQFGANRIAAFCVAAHLEKMARLITQTTAVIWRAPARELDSLERNAFTIRRPMNRTGPEIQIFKPFGEAFELMKTDSVSAVRSEKMAGYWFRCVARKPRRRRGGFNYPYNVAKMPRS